MKNIIFATFATDDTWMENLAKPLANSFHYFHPSIPFKIFNGEEMNSLLPKDYFIKICGYKAFVGAELAKEYKHVVFIDSDSLVVGKLTEILEWDYELAGVRCVADNGCVHSVNAKYNDLFILPGLCGFKEYLNAGLIASRASEFWPEWIELNRQLLNQTRDQDQQLLNRIFYSGRYKSMMLDPIDSLVHYGVSILGDMNPSWDGWRDIELENDRLFINSLQEDGSKIRKQIKVLHLAGNQDLFEGVPKPAPSNRGFNKEFFKPEVYDFIKRITA